MRPTSRPRPLRLPLTAVLGAAALLVLAVGAALAGGTAPDFRWSAQTVASPAGLANTATWSASDGVYAAGVMNGDATFGTGVDGTTLTAPGGKAAYIAKYGLDGTFDWATTITITGTPDMYGPSLVGGADEGVYLTLQLKSSVSDATWTVSGASGSSASGQGPGAGSFFGLLVHYLPDGSVDWAQPIRSSVSSVTLSSASVAPDGVYVTGAGVTYGGVPALATLGTGPDQTTASGLTYIGKYDLDGTVEWVRSPLSGGASGLILAADAAGVYLTSYFSSAVTAEGTTLTPSGFADGLVLRLDATGTFQWVRQFGGTSGEAASAVVARPEGVYLAGYFYDSGTAVFGSGEGATTLTSAGSTDPFLAAYSPTGEFRWVRSSGSTGDDRPSAIAATTSGVVVGGGFVSPSLTFGSGADATTLTKGAGSWAGFLAGYGSDGTFEWARRIGDATGGTMPTGVSVGPELLSIALRGTFLNATVDITLETSTGTTTVPASAGATILATYDAPVAPPPSGSGGDMGGSGGTPTPEPSAGTGPDLPSLRGVGLTIATDRRVVRDRVPLIAGWTGETTGTYELQTRIGSDAWSAPRRVTGTRAAVTARAGRRVRVRVRPVDASGGTGSWVLSRATTPRVVQESAATYRGAWQVIRAAGYSGGAARVASASGRTATFRVRGSAVALVTSTARVSGRIGVAIDGVLAVRRNLAAPTTRRGVVTFARSWATSGSHTVRVTVLPGATGRWVAVDALIVLD